MVHRLTQFVTKRSLQPYHPAPTPLPVFSLPSNGLETAVGGHNLLDHLSTSEVLCLSTPQGVLVAVNLSYSSAIYGVLPVDTGPEALLHLLDAQQGLLDPTTPKAIGDA